MNSSVFKHRCSFPHYSSALIRLSKEILRGKLWVVHPAEQKFAFASVLFGLLCLSQSETLIGLHKAHFRKTIWDRNFQLPTWHCLDLHCQSIYSWLWGLLYYRQQSCCSGTFSNFHCSTAQAKGRVAPSQPWERVPKKGCSAETQPHLGGHSSFAQHLSSLLEVHLWLLTPPCSVLDLCNHEPVFLLLLFESLTFHIQCDTPLGKTSLTNPLWNTRASNTW